MLVFLKNVLSWIIAILLCYSVIAGIINFIWFVLHLIFPKHIKYDSRVDFNDDEGRYDGWSR